MKLIWLYICTLSFSSLFAQVGSLEGMIYAMDTAESIAAAKMILYKDNVYCKKAKTDHLGNFYFVNLEAGNYSLWILKDGFCQLELQAIVLTDSQSVHLDLGLLRAADSSVAASADKIIKFYQGPIFRQGITTDSLMYQTFCSDYNIINEVYRGPEIRIAPPPPIAPSLPADKATHFNETWQALERSKPY